MRISEQWKLFRGLIVQIGNRDNVIAAWWSIFQSQLGEGTVFGRKLALVAGAGSISEDNG